MIKTNRFEALRNQNNFLLQRILDLLTILIAGFVVAVAYYFFQNSNDFAPGGVGGLATMTYHFLDGAVNWSVMMILFNLPLFVLVTIFIDRKLGIYLIIYMAVQSFFVELFETLGVKPYCLQHYEADFEIVFACIATGVTSGFGFSMMLRRFGASGGTYAISALIKKWKPHRNIAYVSFWMDSAVVAIAFFVYGKKITPTLCTLINLFVANIIVNKVLSGMKDGYKFEIVTENPEELSQILIDELRHSVTQIQVQGMYSHMEKYMLVCIIRKNQVGQMMRILRQQPGTFASFTHVNEVFGRFKP